MSRRVPGAPKNRSGRVWGASGGVRRRLGAQVGFQGDSDQIFNDFSVPLGSHLRSFWDDFFDFFNVVLQVALDMCFSLVFGSFGHQKLKLSARKNVDFL